MDAADMNPESAPAERFGVSLSGLWRRPPWVGGDRGAVRWAADAGVRCLELDASMPGLRPRSLDRSARRDLAALVRRCDLLVAGIDLPIPPSHFVSPADADRAIAATIGALGLMADLSGVGLGRGYVSVALPPADEGGGYLAAIVDASERFGVPLADSSWPMREGALADRLRVSFDTAGVLAAGDDVTAAAAAAAGRAVALRLADLAGAGRVAVGEGALDVAALRAVAATLLQDAPVVAHLAGLERPDRGLPAARRRWVGSAGG